MEVALLQQGQKKPLVIHPFIHFLVVAVRPRWKRGNSLCWKNCHQSSSSTSSISSTIRRADYRNYRKKLNIPSTLRLTKEFSLIPFARLAPIATNFSQVNSISCRSSEFSSQGLINRERKSHFAFLSTVVYHHGKSATGGHYTTDIYHIGVNGWIHMDDATVIKLPQGRDETFKHVPHRVPYLLYYRRCDLLQ